MSFVTFVVIKTLYLVLQGLLLASIITSSRIDLTKRTTNFILKLVKRNFNIIVRTKKEDNENDKE